MANIDYITEKDAPKLEKVLREITSIDNRMSEVFELSGQRQTIVMKDKHRIEFLQSIEKFFTSQNTPIRSFIGSTTIILNNCTVRVYREDRKINKY